jgi:DnaJ-class molecular chaperone
MDNVYNILGVTKTSSDEEIKKAYRKLSLKHHPDRNGGNKEIFQNINKAYNTIDTKEKRQKYELSSSPFGSNVQFNEQANQMFEMFFKHNNPYNSGNIHVFSGLPRSGIYARTKPPSIQHRITITLKQSYSGVKIPIDIERIFKTNRDQRTEKERMYVDIPKGIDKNEIITITNKGHVINECVGDIKIYINITNKSSFIRQGMDLKYIHQLTFKESFIGFSFILSHISGQTFKINNSDGTIITPGYCKVINGMGMARVNKNPTRTMMGNLIIEFKIKYPTQLTAKQTDVIRDNF